MRSEVKIIEWPSKPCMMGIDEAGRGPVLGPMVYGCLYCPLSYKETLSTLEFADSKTLKEEKREELFENLKVDEEIGWAVDVINPGELSAKMLKKNKINLNEISHESAMGLVKRVLDMGYLLTELIFDFRTDGLLMLILSTLIQGNSFYIGVCRLMLVFSLALCPLNMNPNF
ncbi:hypothetical protein L6452_36805 [Arctium lappa]|uniref:Uncharacterized protein n=1 Tax=Arctium lappa TaxID=4217 RepID=A0ACB8Y1R7_ARCLA|nr:hypothetical protein L6452_36805 [Arctium lappa]